MYIPKPGSFEITLREHHSTSGELHYEEHKSGDRAALIDEVFGFHNQLSYIRYSALERAFPLASSVDEVNDIVKNLRTTLFYQTAIEAFIFGHLKFFDPALPPDHIDNYYMEREWRVAGTVKFQATNVQRMFVSPAFADQARRDFPELVTRITTL